MKKIKNEAMIQMMLEKSQESFLLAIEVYNKPTIKFRVEGFCFFICNAWELLLKAYMLNSDMSIYFKDKKNINRTISLRDALLKIFTNSKDPLRINLETVIGIRNMANHLIIPEYAALMNEVFMACTRNYTIKLKSLFNINISNKIPSNFLTMFIPSESLTVDIEGNYGKEIFNQYMKTKRFLTHAYAENSNNEYVNESYAVSFELTLKKTSDKDKADLLVANVSSGKAQVGTISIIKNANEKTHPLSCNQLIQKVNEEFESKNIKITPISDKAKTYFTTTYFFILSKEYKFKENEEFACKHVIGKTVQYSYSFKLVQKIIDLFVDNPDIIVKIKKS